jgi:ADP-heptose:LPS heptosyltransferase
MEQQQPTQRSKAFFLNGGAGRVLCSIPALEKYEEESGDKDFIIVCEGGTEVFKGHPTLDSRTYDNWHKNLFVEKIKDRDCVTPEPYRVWEYYNQKCDLAQAFDIEINRKGIRELPKPNLRLSKDELLVGRQLIADVKKKIKKEKIIVFQPFGRGIDYVDGSFVDRTNRSFEFKDVKSIIRKLQEANYGVVMMGEMRLDLTSEKLKDDVAAPENTTIRQWAAIIKYADHFLGCDSVGQHLAYIVGKQSTVVFGSTYPVNVSYPNCKYMNLLDMAEEIREYSPIRITLDERIDRKLEGVMSMTPEIVDYVVNAVLGKKQK